MLSEQLLSGLECLAGLFADCVVAHREVVEHEGVQLHDIYLAVPVKD